MAGKRRCSCGLHYIAWFEDRCWFCRNGYDPRGPFTDTKEDE